MTSNAARLNPLDSFDGLIGDPQSVEEPVYNMCPVHPAPEIEELNPLSFLLPFDGTFDQKEGEHEFPNFLIPRDGTGVQDEGESGAPNDFIPRDGTGDQDEGASGAAPVLLHVPRGIYPTDRSGEPLAPHGVRLFRADQGRQYYLYYVSPQWEEENRKNKSKIKNKDKKNEKPAPLTVLGTVLGTSSSEPIELEVKLQPKGRGPHCAFSLHRVDLARLLGPLDCGRYDISLRFSTGEEVHEQVKVGYQKRKEKEQRPESVNAAAAGVKKPRRAGPSTPPPLPQPDPMMSPLISVPFCSEAASSPGRLSPSTWSASPPSPAPASTSLSLPLPAPASPVNEMLERFCSECVRVVQSAEFRSEGAQRLLPSSPGAAEPPAQNVNGFLLQRRLWPSAALPLSGIDRAAALPARRRPLFTCALRPLLA